MKSKIAIWPDKKKKQGLKRKNGPKSNIVFFSGNRRHHHTEQHSAQRSSATWIIGIVIVVIVICIIFFPNVISNVVNATHNPNYYEMVDFIQSDDTDQNVWTEQYTCHYFTNDVIRNAKAEGITAGYVRIDGVPDDHAIVCFQTTDRGLWFVEPQMDVIFSENEMDDMVDAGIYSIHDSEGYFDFEMIGYSIDWSAELIGYSIDWTGWLNG